MPADVGADRFADHAGLGRPGEGVELGEQRPGEQPRSPSGRRSRPGRRPRHGAEVLAGGEAGRGGVDAGTRLGVLLVGAGAVGGAGDLHDVVDAGDELELRAHLGVEVVDDLLGRLAEQRAAERQHRGLALHEDVPVRPEAVEHLRGQPRLRQQRQGVGTVGLGHRPAAARQLLARQDEADPLVEELDDEVVRQVAGHRGPGCVEPEHDERCPVAPGGAGVEIGLVLRDLRQLGVERRPVDGDAVDDQHGAVGQRRRGRRRAGGVARRLAGRRLGTAGAERQRGDQQRREEASTHDAQGAGVSSAGSVCGTMISSSPISRIVTGGRVAPRG
ncbi:MAG: hypothetical protein R2699_03860 [Acidimicrobiales bacterium]